MIERITSQIMLTTDATIQRADVREIVRKTLEAIHEPTAAMIDAGTDAEFPAGDLGRDQVAAVLDGGWRAMIEKAVER